MEHVMVKSGRMETQAVVRAGRMNRGAETVRWFER
jgi:hypothetical protein